MPKCRFLIFSSPIFSSDFDGSTNMIPEKKRFVNGCLKISRQKISSVCLNICSHFVQCAENHKSCVFLLPSTTICGIIDSLPCNTEKPQARFRPHRFMISGGVPRPPLPKAGDAGGEQIKVQIKENNHVLYWCRPRRYKHRRRYC